MKNSTQITMFGLEKVLSALFGFATVKILTGSLSQDDFGNFELYILTVSLINILISWGLGSSIARELLLFNKPGTVVLQSAFKLCSYSFIIVSSLFFLLVIFDHYSVSKLLIAISSMLMLLVNVFLSLSRGISRADYYCYSSILQSTAYLLLIIFIGTNNVNLILLAYTISLVIQLTILIILFRKFISINELVDSATTRSMLIYGSPLILASLSAFLFNLSDRYFIGLYLSLSDLAKYSISYKVCSIMMMVISAVQLIWPKIMYGEYNKESNDIKGFDIYFRAYAFVLGIMLLFLSLNSRELIVLISNDSYVLDNMIIYIICSGMFYLALMYINSSPMHVIGKTNRITSYTIFAGGINVLLNLVLIPNHGVYGAALSTFISMFLVFTLSGYFSYEILSSKLSYSRVVIFYVFITTSFFSLKDIDQIVMRNIYAMLCLILSLIVLKPKEMYFFLLRGKDENI